MSVGHLHPPSAAINPAHERDLEKLLANAEFRAEVSAYDREDCDHDVPFVGGSLTDWRTICWDRHLCAAIAARRFLIAGKPEDPRRTGKVHEAVEGAIIHKWDLCRQLLGWPQTDEKYPRAHDVADVAEHHAVIEAGWEWLPYQSAWKPFIRIEEREAIVNPPPNLLLDAYKGTPLFAKLAAAQRGSGNTTGTSAPASPPGGGKLTHEQAGYHKGPGKTGTHCSICHHFILAAPPDCEIVQPPIGPNDGCNYFMARSGKPQVRRKGEFHPSQIGARLARDGKHYLPDPKRPGKYLMVVPHAGQLRSGAGRA